MFSAGVWGTVSDWLLAALAGATAVVAYIQLRAVGQVAKSQIEASAKDTLAQITAATEAHNKELTAALKSGKDQALIARATLILEIDRDYESELMQESRLAIRGLWNEIEALVRAQNRGANGQAIEAKSCAAFGEYMNHLWRDFKNSDTSPLSTLTLEQMKNNHVNEVNRDPSKIQPHEHAGKHYQRLTRILGWLERVGHMANQGLLPERDVKCLYDEIFVKLGSQFEDHIVLRRSEGNSAFMKEFMDFRQKIIDGRRPRGRPKISQADGISGFLPKEPGPRP